MKKPLPFTRSLAEFSRNRSQKDVTATTSADQIAATNTAGASAITSTTITHQTPPHQIKGTIELTKYI